MSNLALSIIRLFYRKSSQIKRITGPCVGSAHEKQGQGGNTHLKLQGPLLETELRQDRWARAEVSVDHSGGNRGRVWGRNLQGLVEQKAK